MLKALRVALVVVVSCIGMSSAAPGLEGDVEIGAYGGYTFPDDYGANFPKNGFHLGTRLGYFINDYVSLEPSYQVFWTNTKRAVGPQNGMKISSLRFNLIYNLLPQSMVRPFVTGGIGWEHALIHSSLKSDDLGVNAGLGVRVFITENIAARLDGRFIYTEVGSTLDKREYNYEGSLGVSYHFGGKPPKDTDGDGVTDKKDKCADTPTGATVDTKGCPTDSDGDGVFDGVDQCADTAKGIKADASGCPTDTDGDAVADGIDQCADTPKGAKVDEKGCPIDTDADGVFDGIDQCPDTVKDSKVDDKGCVAVTDADNDGVLDDKDMCLNTPAGTKVDDKGCPMKTKSRGVLKGVTFKFGSAELAKESFPVLDAVAADLNEFPNVKVEVQGHTDKTGPEPANVKLSQARAQSVVKYLTSKGVDASRLVAKGYGSSKPIGDNKTKIGKRQNRRVELVWLD